MPRHICQRQSVKKYFQDHYTEMWNMASWKNMLMLSSEPLIQARYESESVWYDIPQCDIWCLIPREAFGFHGLLTTMQYIKIDLFSFNPIIFISTSNYQFAIVITDLGTGLFSHSHPNCSCALTTTSPPTCSLTVTPAVLWDHLAVLAITAIIGSRDNYTASTHQAGLLH